MGTAWAWAWVSGLGDLVEEKEKRGVKRKREKEATWKRTQRRLYMKVKGPPRHRCWICVIPLQLLAA